MFRYILLFIFDVPIYTTHVTIFCGAPSYTTVLPSVPASAPTPGSSTVSAFASMPASRSASKNIYVIRVKQLLYSHSKYLSACTLKSILEIVDDKQ